LGRHRNLRDHGRVEVRQEFVANKGSCGHRFAANRSLRSAPSIAPDPSCVQRSGV
jgi:hypothetical protein